MAETAKMESIAEMELPYKERRTNKNIERRDFINWLNSLDDVALLRQWGSIKIHTMLTPENEKWEEAKNDYNIVAKRRGFDTIE